MESVCGCSLFFWAAALFARYLTLQDGMWPCLQGLILHSDVEDGTTTFCLKVGQVIHLGGIISKK
jgi:hypothetical protein